MQQEEQTTRRGNLAAKYSLQLVFALTLASFYLIGEIFRDGYLTYFHLEPSMFPISVQSTYIESVWALSSGLELLLDAINQAIRTHGLKILLVWLVLSVPLGIAFFLMEVRNRRSAPAAIKQNGERHWVRRVGRALLRSGSLVALSGVATITLIVGLAMFLIMLIAPFTKAGARVAAQDAAKGFSDQPMVALQAPDGTVQDFRVMECAGDYCALFRQGQAYAVRKDEVNWAAPSQAANHPLPNVGQ